MNKCAFDLIDNETVLRQEASTWLRSKWNVQAGRIYLTTHRLVFSDDPFPFLPFFSLIGEFMNMLAQRIWPHPRKPAFEVPLREISTFEQGSFGLNKRVMVLHTAAEDQTFGFTRSYEEWEGALKEAMKRK